VGTQREEEAAATVGAGYVRRLVAIVVPRHAAALAAAWLLVFVFCLRDLDGGIVVHPPGGETLLVRIFTLEANGPEPVVAALAMIQVAVTLGIASLAAWLSLRGAAR
jgi:ABC-type spermidine/putrescine transport system permease subunit II